jgi:hypothetical protein
MPDLIQPLLMNGLIMGVGLSIVLEKIVDWDKEELKS